MFNLIKLLPKYRQTIQNYRGFTLIELIVAMSISTIIVTTLLAFVNNMMDTERKEQAKATTEQEIQAALDYITDDLQAAVYIYDADGIAAIKSQLPHAENQNHVPVLVFWKRSFLDKDSEVTLADGSTARVGCLAKIPNTTDCNQRDYSVYSLVAYYLINNTPESNNSSVAQVARIEVQNGIKDPYNPNEYLPGKPPDPGFKSFDLTLPGNIQEKMNAWTKEELVNYDFNKTPTETLIEYIDSSTGSQVPVPEDCQTTTSTAAQQVPADNPLETTSFYACVDSSKTLAKIYLRGNALARINQDATYSDRQVNFFPAASVQVQSQGKVDAE